MKFSIITCTYNSAKWLDRNITSVRNQSYKNFEHIFIDGFSSDQTLNIINDYKNKFNDKVKLFQSMPGGISDAMNEGIKKSTGDYLIHLHSDDSFFDDQVLDDVRKFLGAKNPDWIYGKINVTEENGENTGSFPNKKIFQQNFKNKFGNYLLKYFNYIPHQAVFIKKEVFKNNGYFDADLSSSMDFDLWLRIIKKTKWYFFDRVISNYCLRGSSESSSLKNKQINDMNYRIVQGRYLNIFERPLAKVINFVVDKKNKNYR